jgi:signal transduction histidine kinase
MDEQGPGFEVRERAAVAEVVTAVLRHDLRNRFSSIRNASYYLMRQVQKVDLWKSDPRVEVFFQLIDKELASAEQLLSARGPATPEVEQGAVELEHAAQRALERSRIPATVRVERHWSPQAPLKVLADEESLTLIIHCLMDNAVEAMPEGGTLGVRTLRSEDGQLIVEVADTGPGIPEELRARVFEPFMTTRPGHAGVGLCIVQRLALRSRASVELAVGEPVGTRVRVCFPAP